MTWLKGVEAQLKYVDNYWTDYIFVGIHVLLRMKHTVSDDPLIFYIEGHHQVKVQICFSHLTEMVNTLSEGPDAPDDISFPFAWNPKFPNRSVVSMFLCFHTL